MAAIRAHLQPPSRARPWVQGRENPKTLQSFFCLEFKSLGAASQDVLGMQAAASHGQLLWTLLISCMRDSDRWASSPHLHPPHIYAPSFGSFMYSAIHTLLSLHHHPYPPHSRPHASNRLSNDKYEGNVEKTTFVTAHNGSLVNDRFICHFRVTHGKLTLDEIFFSCKVIIIDREMNSPHKPRAEKHPSDAWSGDKIKS